MPQQTLLFIECINCFSESRQIHGQTNQSTLNTYENQFQAPWQQQQQQPHFHGQQPQQQQQQQYNYQQHQQQHQQYLQQQQQQFEPQYNSYQQPQYLQPQPYAPQTIDLQYPEQQTQQPHVGRRRDESVPWRRSKTSKVRSRSLQPNINNIEKLPWLRSNRDRSVPKQPTFLQNRGPKAPVRPWIEEVIKLKRTELHQKVIERAQLEKVELKEAHIERREIPKEELEKIDLKHLEWSAEGVKQVHLQQLAEWQKAIFGESGLTMHNIKHEDRMQILEVTQQIDELTKQMAQADKSQAVPWEVQRQQLKTIERAQKIIDRFRMDEVELHSVRSETVQQEQQRQQQHQEHRIQSMEQRTHEESSNIMKRHESSAMEMHQIQMQKTIQTISHTDESSMLQLSENTKLEMRQIEQMPNEQATMWQRGKKLKESEQSGLSYVEDSTILSLNESEKITQRYTDLAEEPIAWRRGPKQRQADVSQSTIELLPLEQEEQRDEEHIQSWQHEKDVASGIVSHIEDATFASIQKQKQIVESSLKRELKKQASQTEIQLTHVEDATYLKHQEVQEIFQKQQSGLNEIPVAWRRGPKAEATSEEVLQHEEDTIFKYDDVQQILLQSNQPELNEVPTMWKRGPKPKTAETVEEPIESVEVIDVTPARKPSRDEVKPWKDEKVELKATRRQSVEVKKLKPAKDEVQLKPVKKPVPQTEEKPQEAAVVEQPTEEIGKAKPWKEEKVELKPTRRESVEVEKLKPAKDAVQLKPVRKPSKPQIDEQPKEALQPVQFDQAQVVVESVESIEIEERPLPEQSRVDKDKAKSWKEEKVELKPTRRQSVEVEKLKPAKDEVQLKPVRKSSVTTEEKTTVELKPVRKASLPVEKVDEEVVVEEEEEVKMTEKRKKVIKSPKKPTTVQASQQDEAFIEENVTELIAETKETAERRTHPVDVQIIAPRFVQTLQSEVCEPNAPTILTATIEGHPISEIRWYFNNVELTAEDNYEVNIVENTVQLKIAQVTPNTVGVYSCQVQNEAGVAVSSANIALGMSIFLVFLFLIS